MKITYNELQNLEIKESLESLNPKFFQLGHEIEEIIDNSIDKLVTGEIVEIKEHPESDKLKVCFVDIGKEKLQIVCGAPNVKSNQKVIVAIIGCRLGNLEINPTKIKNIESNGMLCSLEELGFSKNLLDEEDYLGIYELPENIKIGTNPMTELGLNTETLDIFLTANRGDCQSYRGMYNDITALLNYNQNEKKYPAYEEIFQKNNHLKTSKEIYLQSQEIKYQENSKNIATDFSQTPFFSLKEIKNIKIGKSPWEQKRFLLTHGLKNQNNITDISNEILLKWGIPSHIYDLDKIVGNVEVKLTTQKEGFIGLDEKKVELPIGTLIVCDSQKIIAIAGVMGSLETKITEQTQNILIEVAEFESKYVFKSSKIIGTKTEAAQRYEKKIDSKILPTIMNIISNKIIENEVVEFGQNIKDLEVSQTKIVEENEVKTEESIKKSEKNISLNLKNVEKILGIHISQKEIEKILTYLNFEIQSSEDTLKVTPPSYRNDINIENDLIEEIIRVYNIDNIPDGEVITSFIPFEPLLENKTINFTQKIEKIFLQENLNQIISYSLVSSKEIIEWNGDIEKAIKIASPLSQNHEYYRQSLLSSLIQTAKTNLSYQEKSISFFEVANTYFKIKRENNEEKLIEEVKIAGIIGGEKDTKHIGKKELYNFFDLKHIVKNACEKLNLNLEVVPLEEEVKELNPYASGVVKINGKSVGIIGEVVYDYYKKMSTKLYVFEISLNKLQEISEAQQFKYKIVNNFPVIERDLTFEVNRDETYSKIKDIFQTIKYIKEIKLMDIYEGEHIDKTKKSITFKITFSDPKQTLTGEIIDIEINKIFDLCDTHGYVINR